MWKLKTFLLPLFVIVRAFASDPLEFRVNTSETVKVPNLIRVAIANSSIVRVRSLPPDRILLTALKPGSTMVRAWSKDNSEWVFPVVVKPAEETERAARGGVIKVAIEFLELSSQFRDQLGVKWPEAIQFSAGAATQGGANLSGINFVGSLSTARGMISLLLKEGWAKMLAQPELYVRLGEETEFHSGGEIPISTTSEDYGRFHRNVEWKPFGLSLKVRPQSLDDLMIRSDVEVEVSETNAAFAVDGLPSLMKRSLKTKMESQDGDTVILSGLVRELQTREKQKTPGLGSIPIVGSAFFTQDSANHETTEVFIAMTLSFTSGADRKEGRARMQGRKETQSPWN